LQSFRHLHESPLVWGFVSRGNEGGLMRALLRASLVSLALVLAAPAAGQDLQKGVEAAAHGDYAAALREFRPLAERGNAVAQYNLGIMYENGDGVPQDYAEAMQWYRLAAGQGLAAAQVNLGVMYYEGLGVPQDYVVSARWARLAAEQGYAIAQYNLGNMYVTGRGVPQDYVKAHMWFNLAAARGDADAEKNRATIAGHMTPDQIAEAQRLAREWLENHQ
jgi:TPR repeat protein